MANSRFTKRLRQAVDGDAAAAIPALRIRSGSLFSPIYRDGKYVWVKLMDSDGLLVKRRRVHSGSEGAPPRSAVSLTLGVVIQSEDSTSQTKPNPFGKAAIGHVSNGIWVDLTSGRRRLDRVMVLFVLPKGTAQGKQKAFLTAKTNVRNAADVMPDARTLELPKGASAAQIATALIDEVRPFLNGRGRPKGAA